MGQSLEDPFSWKESLDCSLYLGDHSDGQFRWVARGIDKNWHWEAGLSGRTGVWD